MSVKVGNRTNLISAQNSAAKNAQNFKSLNDAVTGIPKKESYAGWAVLADQNKKLENTDLSANNYSQWADVPATAFENQKIAATAALTGKKTPVVPSGGPLGASNTAAGGTSYAAWADAPAYQGTGTVKRLSSSGGNNTVSPITEGEGGTKGTGGTEKGYSVWADVKLPETETDDSFAKWLEADPAYREALKKAQGDYDRALATYGAQGEALARSGLVGSGYSQWADAQAYAQMQSAKQNAFDRGYSQWLNEKQLAELEAKEAAAEEKAKAEIEKANIATITQNFITEAGVRELTDADVTLLKSQGYSDSEIASAKTYIADYKAKSKAQESEKFKTSLTNFNTDGDANAFLAANGISTIKKDGTVMSDAEIASAAQSAVEDAFKNGKISAEERSAHYRDMIVSYKPDSDSIENVVDAAASIIGKADAYKNENKLTDNDYKAALTDAYDRLNIVRVSLGDVGYAADEVKITVNVNGVERTYVADMSGEARANKERNSTLNETYGDASLAYYDGKVYYQYETDKWVQIRTKKGWGSPGSTSEGNDVLRVVAAYCGENKINYRPTPEFRQIQEYDTENSWRVTFDVSESDWRKLQAGTMSREDFIAATVKRYSRHWAADPKKAAQYVEEYLALRGVK